MTITKLTSPLLLAAALLFTSACDTEDAAPTADRAAEDADAEFAPEHDSNSRHDGKHARRNPAAHLCEELACSDEQRTQIEALFESQREAREDKRGDKDARKAARTEANATLAAAFRAETFDAEVLEQLQPSADPSARIEKVAAFAVQLHALLSPEQRTQLAKVIEARGPKFMQGPGGKHHGAKGKHHGPKGKHHGAEGECDHEGPEGEAECNHEGPEGKRHGPEGKRHGDKGEKRSPEARLAHHVERFCEPLSCTDEQQVQLQAALAGAHEARKDAPKPDFKPFADAFAADTLEADTIERLAAETMSEGKGAHTEGFANILSEVHAILTPEQRSTFADKIEAEGLRAVMGKRGHGKRGKRGHGKRGHDAPPAE